MVSFFLTTTAGAGYAQIIEKIGKRAEQKAKQRADQKVNQGIDKGLDKVEDAASGKNKKKKEKDTVENGKTNAGNSADESFKVNTNFDFVAGDKVLALDDFSAVNIGDFPGRWNTNGSGEVVTIDGYADKWLELRGNFTYYPEFINSLPDNFTLEYDLIYNYDTKYLVRNIFGIYILATDKSTMQEPVFKHGFNKPGRTGAAIEFHSYKPNVMEIYTWENKKTNEDTRTKSNADFIKQVRNKKVHISLWKQKGRVRMYLNDKKIVDAPSLLKTGEKYNMIKLGFEDWENNGRAYISNFRFAASTPDMRSKLITEGKFVTSGIYFSSNSDKIKPESYGILKEIAAVLKDNPAVRVKVTGYTDSDGATDSNLELSKKRAEAVKKALASSYGIDASRFETEGKGEQDPIASNTTEEGKANNRRVEFVKLK